MVSSVSVTTCSASDLSCLCTNSVYISTAVKCINKSCDATDAQNSYAYASYACSTVGVTVPSVASVLGSGPPAPAPPPPAPPAAPKAPAPAAPAAPAPAPAASVVTFQGAASHAAGMEKGFLTVFALGVAGIIGAGML